MGIDTSWRRTVAVLAVSALVVVACGGDEPSAGPPRPEPGVTTDGPDPDVVFDLGVTLDPCPDAINPNNGCIYLGVLSDLSEGPFFQLAVPITEGQYAFFDQVNLHGGIAGFDVDVRTYTRDTLYQAQEHSARYREIEPNILALAQTLGTPTTEAILRDMDADDVIGAPASWWSGWDFEQADHGLILNSGYSYCLESMIGLDWFVSEYGDISAVAHVGYPGDYGGDSAVGVQAWADVNGVSYAGSIRTLPNPSVGTQDEAIRGVMNSGADVVVMAVGPAEAAEIIGTAVAQGFDGRFLGSVPTWNPALLGSAAAPAMISQYTHVAPWETFDGQSVAHQRMRESLGGSMPANDGYTFGWIWSYPILAALEAAADNGDLTRAGLRSVVDGLVVDYEGALPPRTFGGDANQHAVRQAAIGVPDEAQTLGVRTIATNVTSPTADAFDYASPCVGF